MFHLALLATFDSLPHWMHVLKGLIAAHVCMHTIFDTQYDIKLRALIKLKVAENLLTKAHTHTSHHITC